MKLEGEQVLLRVYLRSTDKRGWQTAAEALVERARRDGLAGATLLRGICGLDFTDGELLDRSAWSLAEHVPVIVELVDRAAAIIGFMPAVRETMPESTLTLERAHVMLYRHDRASAALGDLRRRLPVPVANLSTVPSAKDLAMIEGSVDGQLLRIFVGESDSWHGEPLARAVVLKARELGLAGATVLRGVMGYGANSRMHSSRLLELSADLPVVIEVVDTTDQIELLLPFLDEAIPEGLVTIESVRVVRLGGGASG
jgi:PII-like signaling protein